MNGRYLLPDKHKLNKQKTSVMRKTCDPKWNHTFIYEDVTNEELIDRCLELTVWDYDKITSNDFLGGVRLSLGLGERLFVFIDSMLVYFSLNLLFMNIRRFK